MYSRILVPLDGSAVAEQVLPYVRVLAGGLKTPVALLRVFEIQGVEGRHRENGGREAAQASAYQWSQSYLHDVARPLADDGFDVMTLVVEGEAANEITAEAEHDPSALIAMTTHGRSGIQRWLMGSVAEKVLRAVRNPLLLYRASDLPKGREVGSASIRTVIVTLDGSRTAEQVLPHVTFLAKALDLSVTLLRVTPTQQDFYRFAGYIGGRFGDSAAKLEAAANAYLHEVGNTLRAEGVHATETVLRGDPARTIVDVARGTEGNLVALTSHGASGFERWLLGSVAERVVHHSGDPVLLVRALLPAADQSDTEEDATRGMDEGTRMSAGGTHEAL